ncbi:MAG: FAD-dependent oxidoreductase [Deltaproteobacteria bacterium]|nr:FAD-dependent oxidoreductase [Deltaproteobacteria bacterium]
MQAKEESKSRVIVLGAGPAGLAAAYFAQKRGCQVVLIEKQKFVGGKGASRREGDYILDFGPHAFHPKCPEINDLIMSHAGEDYILTSVTMDLIIRNTKLKYPFKPVEGVLKLPLSLSFRMLADYLVARIKNFFAPSQDHSFKDWGLSRFGKTLYEVCFGHYTERVWGLSADKISVELAKRKLPRFSIWAVIKEAVTKRGTMHEHLFTKEFGYHRQGIGSIYNNIARTIEQEGGRVMRGAEIESLISEAGRITGVRIAGAQGEVIEGDHVVSTIPITKLLDYLGSGGHPLSSELRPVAFRNILLVYAFLDMERFSEAHWTYLIDSSFNFHRISEQKNLSPECCPAGKTVLTFEISASPGSDIWDWQPEQFYPMVLQDLKRWGIKREQIESLSLARLEDAYPIYSTGYESDLKGLLRELGKIPNLVSTGRQGLFLDIDMHDAMVLGELAVAAALEGDAARFYRSHLKLLGSHKKSCG